MKFIADGYTGLEIASLKKFRVVFFQFPEDGADDGFAEKLGLVGNFVFGAKIFNSLIFRIVKYQHFPVLAPRGAEHLLFFMCSCFHRQLKLRRGKIAPNCLLCTVFYHPTLSCILESSTCSLTFAFNAVNTRSNVSIVTLLALFSSREICAF